MLDHVDGDAMAAILDGERRTDGGGCVPLGSCGGARAHRPWRSPDTIGITYTPVRGAEAYVFRLLAVLVGNPDALLGAVGRLLAQVRLVGPTMDATTREGLRRAADALVMLHATRPTLRRRDHLAKHRHATLYRCLGDARMQLLLEHCAAFVVPDGPPGTESRLAAAVARWHDPGWVEDTACPHRLDRDPGEERLFGIIAGLWMRPGDLRSAIDRLTHLVAAQGLGIGMDPDLADGLRLALDALVLLQALRPAAGPDEVRAKAALLTVHQSHGRDHVGHVLALLLDCDRVAFGMSPGDLA